MTYTTDQDPADFTVDEVTAALAAATDAEQIADVKALEATEAGGKGRKGILDFQPTAEGRTPDEDGYVRVPVDAYPTPEETPNNG